MNTTNISAKNRAARRIKVIVVNECLGHCVEVHALRYRLGVCGSASALHCSVFSASLLPSCISSLLIDDSDYQRNHKGSALIYEQITSICFITSIQVEHGLKFPGLCSTRLSCYSAVYYSNVDGDDECWMGLYKSSSDSSTYWLDGNPSTYRNWRSGEPDYDQCVRIKNGEFRDKSCSNTYRYVCKGIYFF